MIAGTTATINGVQYNFDGSGVCQNANGVSAQTPGTVNNNSGSSGGSGGPECPVLPDPVSAAAHRAAPETVQTARPAAIPITAHPAHQLRLNQDGQTDQVDLQRFNKGGDVTADGWTSPLFLKIQRYEENTMKNTTQIMRRCHALALAGLIGAGTHCARRYIPWPWDRGDPVRHGHISRRTGAEPAGSTGTASGTGSTSGQSASTANPNAWKKVNGVYQMPDGSAINNVLFRGIDVQVAGGY